MSTKITGSRFENSPFEDVFSRFEVGKDGYVIKTKEATIKRAKIAANAGFIVDPVTGQGFWGWANPSIALDPTKTNGRS